ncbi:hypothetical protein MRX96_037704 [Rhipicephalus microplus]
MAPVYDFRHVELDKIGRGKRGGCGVPRHVGPRDKTSRHASPARLEVVREGGDLKERQAATTGQGEKKPARKRAPYVNANQKERTVCSRKARCMGRRRGV